MSTRTVVFLWFVIKSSKGKRTCQQEAVTLVLHYRRQLLQSFVHKIFLADGQHNTVAKNEIWTAMRHDINNILDWRVIGRKTMIVEMPNKIAEMAKKESSKKRKLLHAKLVNWAARCSAKAYSRPNVQFYKYITEQLDGHDTARDRAAPQTQS